MKWHWSLLFAGFILYILVLIPGVLPHSVDVAVMILSGISLLSIAVFGFDTIHVDRILAVLMITLSLLMLIAGIVLAWQGHGYILFLLAVPALGLGMFGARKLMDKREKHD
ncbi:MAG: hypothetical protein KPEEDBHJ_00385 [Anaerolineales bacterium]|jgi:hypothetical protein|nr:hypothetical protein [Anaerolineales bacterium]